MPIQQPIACSLSASEMPVRLAEMARIGQDALLSADTSGSRTVIRFRPGHQNRARIEAIVAAEAECCAFLEMAVGDEDDAIVLVITAPPGAEYVLDEMVAAFSEKAQLR